MSVTNSHKLNSILSPEEEKLLSEADDNYLVESLKGSTNLGDQEVNAFLFGSFLVIGLESLMEGPTVENLAKGMIESFHRPDLFHLIFKRLDFTGKIEVFQKSFEYNAALLEKYKPLISLCRTVNQEIRNKMFHNKINEAQYKGGLLTELETRRKLTRDFVIILREMNKPIK